MPVLSEHRLRIGDRAVTLLRGPAGGRVLAAAQPPSDPAGAGRLQKKLDHWRTIAVRTTPGTLVDGPSGAGARTYPAAVKVRTRAACFVAAVRVRWDRARCAPTLTV